MTTRLLLAAASVLLCLAVGPAPAQTPPLLPEYTVLGLEQVTIRRETRVISGAVGTVDGRVRLARAARVANAVAGPTVRLARESRVGNLFCHLVSGPPPLQTCDAFADPLVDPALLPVVDVLPGTDDLRVPPHTGTAPVAPGSFRDIRVGPGSVLQLASGAFMARSLRVGRNARVVCAADCRIGVLGPVRLGQGAGLGAASAQNANTARIDIGAAGGVPAFIARSGANVSATIYAPEGTVVVGGLGTHRGAFIGRKVVVGPRATVRGDSAL